MPNIKNLITDMDTLSINSVNKPPSPSKLINSHAVQMCADFFENVFPKYILL